MNSITQPASFDAVDIARRFEQVAQSMPLDLTARLVASSGVHYEPSLRSLTLGDLWFDQCPKFSRIPGGHYRLTGIKNGNLTCVGYYGNGLWVMRCVCGRFRLKRSQRIRNPTNPNLEQCAVCRRVQHMRDSSIPSDFTKPIQPIAEKITLQPPSPPRKPIFNRFYKKEPIPKEIRWAVWERDDFTCKHCGSRKDLSVDHIEAESKGGKMTLDNLQTLCKPCNSRKGAR